jgi:hypothetical protein
VTATLEELEARVETLEALMLPTNPVEEEKRVERWWHTYNAALGKAGIYAHGPSKADAEKLTTHKAVHYVCLCYATYAHGPLNTPVPAGALFDHMPPETP